MFLHSVWSTSPNFTSSRLKSCMAVFSLDCRVYLTVWIALIINFRKAVFIKLKAPFRRAHVRSSLIWSLVYLHVLQIFKSKQATTEMQMEYPLILIHLNSKNQSVMRAQAQLRISNQGRMHKYIMQEFFLQSSFSHLLGQISTHKSEQCIREVLSFLVSKFSFQSLAQYGMKTHGWPTFFTFTQPPPLLTVLEFNIKSSIRPSKST